MPFLIVVAVIVFPNPVLFDLGLSKYAPPSKSLLTFYRTGGAPVNKQLSVIFPAALAPRLVPGPGCL